MNKILNESKVGVFVEKELTKLHEKKLDDFKKAEENSSEGVSIFNQYADIYRRENFELNQNEKILEDRPNFLVNTSIPLEFRIGQK